MNALETAAFAAWPALEEEDYRGWLLRLSEGYTKRANSLNSTPAAVELTAEYVENVEARFAERGLPTVFRLTSLHTVGATDALLASRGYGNVDLSLVMVRESLSVVSSSLAAAASSRAEWLEAYARLSIGSGASIESAKHARILERIRHPHAFAIGAVDGAPACCALGVIVDGRLGLFDLVTDAAQRGRGHASRLCSQLLDWGSEHGAQCAFLQVTGSNEAAIRLYGSLGFREVYRYWYRVAVD